MNPLRPEGRSVPSRAGRALLAGAVLSGLSIVATATPAVAADVQVTVDFEAAVSTLADSYGITITGYGNQSYITNNATHRGYISGLGARVMRLELMRATPGDPNSAVVCGGGYCDTQITAAAWITAIRDLGGEPMVILPLDGRHAASIDVSDAVGIYQHVVAATGTPVTRFIIGNETNNDQNPKHVSAAEYSSRFNLITDALRGVNATVKVAGPGTSYYDTAYLDTFLAGSGSRVNVVDFHKYAQGGTENKSEAQLLAETDGYRVDTADLRRRINLAVPSRAGEIGVQVGEYNLDWNDDPKQLTGFTTVWSAAALGSMLSTGTTAVQYGDKNGALGLTSQDNVGGVPSDQPLPIYHGISMFTGAGLFRPFGRTMVNAASSDGAIKAFASRDSTSVVLVNTATVGKSTDVVLSGLTAASAQLWRSTAANLTPHPATGLSVSAGTLSLTLPARSVSTVVIEPAAGLRAGYFNNTTLTGSPAVRRADAQLNFDWGTAAPVAGVNTDGFSVRWIGGLRVPTGGSYTFTTTSDDGVRLWVDDVQLVNAWNDHSTRQDSGTVTLTAGRHRIRMEFYDNGWDAVAKLSWAGPGISKQLIPAANLLQSS